MEFIDSPKVYTKQNETSLGERKMRSALINTLLQLNEDKKYDIAVSLAADIGYKLVQVDQDGQRTV